MKTFIILFITLSTLSLAAQNYIVNPGYEEGRVDWISAGADFEISNQAPAGDSAVMITVTDQKYNGIRPKNSAIELLPGTYTASFWVKAADANTMGKKASVKVESVIGTGLAESISEALSNTEWVQVKKEFVVSVLDSVKFSVRANNVDQTGMVMYVDNVELVERKTGVLDGGFEINPITDNWSKLGNATIHRTYATDSVHSGLNACVFTVNLADDGFKNKNDLSLSDGAGEYVLSAWVMGTAGEPCQLRAIIINDGSTSYRLTDYTILQTGEWEKIELSLTMTDANGTIGPMFRQRTFDTQTSFAIDDFMIEKQIATSTIAQSENLLELYPNPAQNVLKIKGVQLGSVYAVYSISGTKVLQNNYQNSGIDVSQMAQGIYYIQTNNETARFIINR